jgi:predicted Ser/Thr protein kinase
VEETIEIADAVHLICPTCSAQYTLPKYVEGQRYGCKRCSASLLFGKFALQKELGRGGFGVVYKAWQVDLHRTVALKFLHSDADESADRFIREARIAAQMSHPNIASIYDVGQHDGKLYITMQYIDGKTLNKAELSIREAVMAVRDASLAVDYAHAREIVHRDIKPHNIMLTQERSGTTSSVMSNRIFVMDFGLARSVSRGGTLTTEGQVVGTPAFMSPEQAEGKTVDTRSDVYSLGATLYSLVTRRPPFEGATPVEILMRVATGSPRPPSEINPDVDPDLETIILKAMALRPEDRYPTAGRLAGDLSLWLEGKTPDVSPTVHLSATPLPGRKSALAPAARQRKGFAVAALAALVVAGAGGVAVVKLMKANPAGAAAGAAGPPKRDPAPPVDPAPPALGALDVRTEPAGATVRLAGRSGEWKTPILITALPAGDYELEITKSQHQPIRERVTLQAGPEPHRVDRKLERAVRRVAFSVDSTPSGARVLIGGIDYGRTPLDIFRDDVKGEFVNVELDLKGFQAKLTRVDLREEPQELTVALEPQTGTFRASGAAPRASVHLIPIPPEAKSPKSMASLWSENADALERALASLDARDAPFVADRLKDLARRAEPTIRALAERLARDAGGSPQPVRPQVSAVADGLGNARLDGAWIVRRYRLLATAASFTDFVSDDLEPVEGEALVIPVRMSALGTVSALMRPPIGRFKVEPAGGEIPADGTKLRVPLGPVVLRYVPPPGDPLLREFTHAATLTDAVEFAGNLYLLSARAAEEKGDPEAAVRGYTKALEETPYPASEEGERRRLPDKIRDLYRAALASLEGKGRAPAGDPARKVEEARRKPAPEALPVLLEIGTARNAAREARLAAAAALAPVLSSLRRPYEAMEWLERCVGANVDPGAEAERAVLGVAKGYPGLSERGDAVSKALAGLRAAAQKKSGFFGARLSEISGKGLRVDALAKGGPAEAAGLAFADVLTEVDGREVRAKADLDGVLNARGEGAEVAVAFERSGQKKSATVRLGPVPGREPEYAEPPSRLGTVQNIHPLYGVFVRLEAGVQVAVGDTLVLFRNGEPAGELTVGRIANADSTYPHGAAVCERKGNVQKGDEARKK